MCFISSLIDAAAPDNITRNITYPDQTKAVKHLQIIIYIIDDLNPQLIMSEYSNLTVRCLNYAVVRSE